MKQHVFNLEQLASIQSGIYCKSEQHADLVYLQARHFDAQGALAVNELHAEVQSTEVPDQHLLQGGDVLFAAKGTKNFAALYESHNPPAVASTTFFVIRIHATELLPEYLCWYLNSQEVLLRLTSKAKGTNVPAINKATLADLSIILPPVGKQQLIAKIGQLSKHATAIQQQLLLLKNNELHHRLFKMINTHA